MEEMFYKYRYPFRRKIKSTYKRPIEDKIVQKSLMNNLM